MSADPPVASPESPGAAEPWDVDAGDTPAAASGKAARRRGLMRALRGAAAHAHLLLPAALTAALAFRAGGYFPTEAAVLAVVMALLLVGRITLSDRPFSGWSPALAVVTGALALFAAWTLLSAMWSGAPSRAMIEFDRALAYLLVLAFMGSFAIRAGDLDRVLRWVALVIAAVALAALITRLYPLTFPTGAGKSPARLEFPITYWNALGVFCAIGLVLALHCTAGARQPAVVRVLAAGTLPVLATTLYFTFSRGGIVAAAFGVVAYAALAHPRRLPVALLATAIPTFVAVKVAYGADGLATEQYARFPGEAADVTLAVAVCAAAAMALRALGLVADRRMDRLHVSRRTRRTALAAVVAVAFLGVAGAAVAADAPSRLADRWDAVFTTGSIANSGDERDRLEEVRANGRVEHWRVAWDAFEREPVTGTGAGTYRLEWDRERPSETNVTDAHSLYVEALGELGLPGLALLLVALLVPLAVAVRRLFGPERQAHAAFLGAGLALLLHAGLDWDWEMPVLFAWYFATAGVVCAARADRAGSWSPGRLTRVAAGLGCLFLTLAPVSVAASQRALDAGTAAFRAGDCAGAIDKSLDSLEALGVRPEPYELLGYCDLRAGRADLAVRAFQAARDRDPDDWQYAYGLAIAEALNRQDPRPMAGEALALNPLDARTRDLAFVLREGDGPGDWARTAARAQVAFR